MRPGIGMATLSGPRTLTYRIVTLLVIVVATTSCRSASVESPPLLIQPGAPGGSSRVITATQAVDLSQIQHTAADVRFMQGMISHHAQALEMTALLPSRSSRRDMRLLGQRIEVSQADEVKMMQRWLEVRGEGVPSVDAHHTHGATLMPGMLTPEEMGRLAGAKGNEFDRLFLEFMITHHEGALVMVNELFSSPGAGQESVIFGFASDVDADQRMEIDRMSHMRFVLDVR